ncbi:histidine phosphatase family protein [Blastococcus sp. CCUG 61487]|uniref:histidine phosphatase family protein n=1 Tax=Blastococcus sp. CCUG 61487 TaxID=1840703 RepID=UPI0010C07CC8|nr:histidine phosphatase family protein [Blastococcus sp. CCUG 61487]TKJ31396.1 phosphoglycerate kinase [Blastococcus sp. CCUG 61487]
MRRIVVVTHPEATHHVAGLVGGWFDSELTDRGRRQAAAIAARVRQHVPADADVRLWTSDLARAAQTAEVVGARLGVRPTLLPALREKSYGVLEGRPQGELDAVFVPPPPDGDRLHHDEGIAGAETKAQFAARVYAAVAEILADPAAHHVVVTHGFALTFVVAAWIGMPLDAAGLVNLRARSGGITVLEQDDFFANRAVLTLDETAHLEQTEYLNDQVT